MQEPRASEDLKSLLFNMVHEDEGERIVLANILSLCRNWTNESEASREVDGLVRYVMGPEEDLEVS